jgi:HSP20 family protein
MIQVVIRPEISPIEQNAGDEGQYFIVNGMRWRLINRPRLWRPPTDVFETDAEVHVRVEIAGMREEDFTVALYGRLLSISGIRSDKSERGAYHQMEIPFGEFAIEIELPHLVDENRVEASYSDGFLKVLLPKMRPHSIRIED